MLVEMEQVLSPKPWKKFDAVQKNDVLSFSKKTQTA